MPKKYSSRDIKGDTLHPRSRKARQLERAQLRIQKLSSKKTTRNLNKVYPIVDRASWFQLVLEPEQTKLEPEQIHELIQMYLARFDGEMAKLQAEQREGRPTPKRILEIKLVRETERSEYEGAGLQIPDLSCPRNVIALKSWDGLYESFHMLRFVRIVAPNKK